MSQGRGRLALNVQLFERSAPPCEAPSGFASRERPAELIGASLEDVRVRLARLTAELQRHLDDNAGPLLDEAQKQLQQASCRIAVIGQVKAGKSTFINALMRQPGLLPTDINPWTAVVTSLHFQNAETPPEHAAVFHLFSADEWNNLAEGGGNLRELTQRLVPGFKPELLRAQIEFMRKRAERRLGKSFHKLLGHCHRFKEMTPELLTDYISAGDDYAEAAADGQRQRYSDITRSAELFFADGPFAFPATLIDTPGTNDPFLVRDEITRRSLDNPDIYVFVLSALQPLSASDISMLRLLNGLHKERIVVFINRADQLADPSGDGAVVKAAVEQRLRLEFPALEIPVVVGSAWMANLGLQAADVDLRAHLKPAHWPLLRRAGVRIDARSDTLSEQDRARLAGALHAMSGIHEISAAITKLMGSSGSAVLLRQIAACFLELTRSAEISAKAELNSIQKLLETRRLEATALGAKIAEERQSLSLFEERTGALRETFKQVEQHLSQLVDTGTETLRNDLYHIVRSFSDEQADAVLRSAQRRNGNSTWVCNVMPLREELEAAYLASFGQMASDIVRIEGFLYPQLKVIVAGLLPDYAGAIIEAPTEPLRSVPSTAALSDTVAMDLGAPWWKLWFAARPSPAERADHLANLIEEEFASVVHELVQEAKAQLARRVGHTMQVANAISDGMMSGIERRCKLLATEYAQLAAENDESALQRFEEEQQNRATACAETSAACAAFGEELRRAIKALEFDHDESIPS